MTGLYDALPVFAQNLACTWAGCMRSRQRFTPHFHRTLAELERSVSASSEALRALQWRRLRRLLEHAKREVPFYAELPDPVDRRRLVTPTTLRAKLLVTVTGVTIVPVFFAIMLSQSRTEIVRG